MTKRFLGTLFLASTFFSAMACGDSSTDDGGGAGGAASTSSTKASSGSTTTATTGTQSTSASTGTTMVEQPTVQLEVTPTTMAAGDTIQGTVTVTNFVLEAPAGQPNQSGHGHYHIYLDGGTGGNYLVAGQTPTTPIKIPANTTPGAHTLRISLGQNNHAEVTPTVEDIVDITVQ